MRSVNKVIVMGYLAADPELKTTTNGHSMAKFSVATNRDWINSDGEKQESADFHRVVAWKGLGEICSKHLSKGAGVYLEGRLSNRKYKDKDGNDRFSTEIVADAVNFINYKKNRNAEEVNLVEVPA